ncbi:MAG TPA: protein kinase [Candidatus Acidoferrales bacterium]|nr:protein kinase [Candidatus Acidoferrales bacterium]
MPLPAGIRLGPYEVLAPLGAGGMGEVYRAHDTRLGRDVAVKVLPASFAVDAERLRRFEQEARATGMLNHPNILALYDVGTFEQSPYLVTELLEGRTLREEMPLPKRKVLDYARQIANGLAAAHAKGVTHRDLKPDNLFITRDGRAKILDFGLAKVEAEARDADSTRTAATTPGMVMGTVGYTSPEQARGGLADHRSDIFSFGVVLYEMLSGARAFQRDSAVETLNAILKEDPPPLADPALDRVVRRCMEKSPDQRFQSASDLAFAIEALSGPMTAATPAVQAAAAGAASARGRGRLIAAAVAVLALAAGAAAGVWWHARQDARAPVWTGAQLTGSGITYGPRISPDGRTLAFISVEGTQSQVAIMHPGSPNWTVLTRGSGEIDLVCWSRDGTKIYFGRRDGVYSVPALGGDERLVLEHANFPEVLPDGSFLMNRTDAQGRQQLHRVRPDSGQIEPLDAEVFGRTHVLPDGRQVVFVGRKLSDAKAKVDVQVFDLTTGAMHPLAPALHFNSGAAAIAPGGRSIFAVLAAGDLVQLAEIGLDGKVLKRLVTLSKQAWCLDAGADGSIYVDQVERPFDVLRCPVSGGVPERLAETAVGAWAIALPDGRAVFGSSVANHATILVAQAGKSPTPFVETEEETRAPLAMLGKNQVIFKLKVGNGFLVAVCNAADGRIVRRLEGTRGIDMSSIAGSADGKTIYYTSNSALWAMPAEGGDARKIGLAGMVAVHPNGQELVLMRQVSSAMRLFRLPLNGGAEQEIRWASPLVLNGALSPGAVRGDGRIAVAVVEPNSWWDELGVLDPATGKVDKLNVPYPGDAFLPEWTADGKLMASGQQMQGSLWRFEEK